MPSELTNEGHNRTPGLLHEATAAGVKQDDDAGDKLKQCCATFLHSRHTKYCRRVMAAHQP
jgi:hypothetical protein